MLYYPKVEYTFLSNGPAATSALGEKIGGKLTAGSVIALTGELGCGKTLLTRGICAGLDVPLRQVNSPTFVLVNEYRGRLPVFHLDMYQLTAAPDAVELGIIDYLARARTGVMIIEWAERVVSLLPGNILKVNFEVLSDHKRRIVFLSEGGTYDDVFKEMKQP
jgi:tRNA threonylcarbamoyladenosine biosynthesis protein TsaE